MYVHTRERDSRPGFDGVKIKLLLLLLLETKFEGREFDYLGQLIVTPTIVAMKIRDMKDNKSPGMDGIPPKLLLEIVEQISIQLATVFNLSLEEGIVPLEWKEGNIIPLF